MARRFLLHSPSIDTGHRLLGGDWLGFFGQSQTTGSCTAPHKQQLQTAKFPVPPRPPAQEGPIKTSHITPLTLLWRAKSEKKKLKEGAGTEPNCECGLQAVDYKGGKKKVFTCVNCDLGGCAAAVGAPSPTRPFMYSSGTVSSLTPLPEHRSEGRGKRQGEKRPVRFPLMERR